MILLKSNLSSYLRGYTQMEARFRTVIPTRGQETDLSPVLGTSKSNVKMEPVTKQIVGKIVNYNLFMGAVNIGYWTAYHWSSTKEETHRHSGRLVHGPQKIHDTITRLPLPVGRPRPTASLPPTELLLDDFVPSVFPPLPPTDPSDLQSSWALPRSPHVESDRLRHFCWRRRCRRASCRPVKEMDGPS